MNLKYKKWTSEEIKILKDNYYKMTLLELSSLFKDRTFWAVKSKISELKINKNNTKRQSSIIKINNEISKIIAFNSLGLQYEAIIDANMEDICSTKNWIIREDLYFLGNPGRVRLNRFLLSEYRNDVCIDHIDGDVLNNRIQNLRVSNKIENGQNRVGLNKNNKTGHRGVFWSKQHQKYFGKVNYNYINVFIFSDLDVEKVSEAVKYARAYIMTFSKDHREIEQENIPQWIKDEIDKKIGDVNA